MAGRIIKTKVCLTVDTEPSVGGAFAAPGRNNPLLHEPVAGAVNGRSEALGFLIRTLREYGLQATFFVEAMHTAYFGEGVMARYVNDLTDAGQDVQLHVHPCWLSFRNGLPDMDNFVSDECASHPLERLVEFFGRGKAQLKRWTGEEPVALRTGSFSTSRAVFKAMRQVDLSVASNICVGYAPPAEPDLRFASGVHDVEGVLEFPVTCFRDMGPRGRGAYRGMQVNACGRWELKALLDAAHRESYPYVIIATHPFEFVKRDSFRYKKIGRNGINQSRLEWLCSYLAMSPDRFEVTTMRALAGEPPLSINETQSELFSGAISSTMRTAQNVINDLVWSL